MPDPELPSIGTVLGHKYRIESLLGEGGMGVVFAATHEKLDQPVAIKMLLPAFARLPELVARFEREARAAAQLRHRNSARVIDVDETSAGIPYMVMERLHGHDLETELTNRGKLGVGEAVHFVIQACSAMGEAHARGIVHRDLKPSNLFLSQEADGSVCIKVLDFGISKVQSDEGRITSTAHQMGTPLYMSPEQVRSAKNVDARTDVWSLGVILYELLSGQPPFSGSAAGIGAAIVADTPPSLRSLRPEIPEGVESVVTKSMAKSAADRFASTSEMISALTPFSSVPLPSAPDVMRTRMASQSSTPSLVAAETLAAPPPVSAQTVDPANEGAAPNATAGSWVKIKSASDNARATTRIIGGLGGIVVLGAILFFISRPWKSSSPTAASAAGPTPLITAVSVASETSVAPAVSSLANASAAPSVSSSAATVTSAFATHAPATPGNKPHPHSATTKTSSTPTAPLNENPERL